MKELDSIRHVTTVSTAQQQPHRHSDSTASALGVCVHVRIRTGAHTGTNTAGDPFASLSDVHHPVIAVSSNKPGVLLNPSRSVRTTAGKRGRGRTHTKWNLLAINNVKNVNRVLSSSNAPDPCAHLAHDSATVSEASSSQHSGELAAPQGSVARQIYQSFKSRYVLAT
jgi:hypothetical protein